MTRFNKKLIFSLLFLALTSYPLHAQVEQENKMFVIDDFSGGLATKPDSFGLQQKYGTVCENIRFDKTYQAISKRDQLLLYGTASETESITGLHRLYLTSGTKVFLVNHGDQIDKGDDDTGAFTKILDLSTGDRKWQWLTWHDLAIGTDGYNQPVKYDGSSASATYLGSCLATDAVSGAGPNGVYTYKITFYTTSYEVSFNTPSNTITVSDNDINLTMIPIGPDSFGGEAIIGRKVYRTSNAGSDYKLLSNGTIANNTATTLTDSDADAARGAALSPGYTYAPPKGKFCLVHKNRLWISGDPTYPSRVYYSEDGSHDYFLPGSYLDVRQNDGDSVTFIKQLLGVLTVGKNRTIQKIYTDGDDPSTEWEISDPLSFMGCQAPYSAVNTSQGIFYLSYDGIYNFNGQYSSLVSDIITPTIKDISSSNLVNCWGIFHRNTYYLSFTSESTGATSNNRLLVFDTLSNAFSVDTVGVGPMTAFASGSDWDVLYSGSSSDGEVYAHSSSLNEIIHDEHSDFTGTWDDMRYIPTRWGGDENSPVIEIARTATIDTLTGTIDTLVGTIDREDVNGTYTSQVLNLGADSFDKLYWNESIPAAGGEVVFNLRSGASSAACQVASWSSDFTDPSGSDVSALTADDYVQYKIKATTDSISYTPTIYKADNFVVKFTYRKEGASTETSIPLKWESGWIHTGNPENLIGLKKLYTIHSGTTGTLSVKFENLEGDIDAFSINLSDHPKSYEEYFTTGKFVGKWFKITITESSLNPIEIKKLMVIYDVEPLT